MLACCSILSVVIGVFRLCEYDVQLVSVTQITKNPIKPSVRLYYITPNQSENKELFIGASKTYVLLLGKIAHSTWYKFKRS